MLKMEISSCEEFTCRVPQGLALGLFLLNIFSNALKQSKECTNKICNDTKLKDNTEKEWASPRTTRMKMGRNSK